MGTADFEGGEVKVQGNKGDLTENEEWIGNAYGDSCRGAQTSRDFPGILTEDASTIRTLRKRLGLLMSSDGS